METMETITETAVSERREARQSHDADVLARVKSERPAVQPRWMRGECVCCGLATAGDRQECNRCAQELEDSGLTLADLPRAIRDAIAERQEQANNGMTWCGGLPVSAKVLEAAVRTAEWLAGNWEHLAIAALFLLASWAWEAGAR